MCVCARAGDKGRQEMQLSDNGRSKGVLRLHENSFARFFYLLKLSICFRGAKSIDASKRGSNDIVQVHSGAPERLRVRKD